MAFVAVGVLFGQLSRPAGDVGQPAMRPLCRPVTGDWDGHPPTTPGLVCRGESSMSWSLINGNATGLTPSESGYGNYDTCLPVTGDWNADGTTTVGAACGGGSQHAIRWSLSNSFQGSPSFNRFVFGDSNICRPVTGDWNGDGTTTVGVGCADGGHIRWQLTNDMASGPPTYPPFALGDTDTCWPVTGDWDGDGTTTVGAACRADRGMRWRLSNGLAGRIDAEFVFGDFDDCLPVTGDWDGNDTTTPGVLCRDGVRLRWNLTNALASGEPSSSFEFGADTRGASQGWPGPSWPTVKQ
jgi:hypothetical protein